MSPQMLKLPYLNRIRNRHNRDEFLYYYRRDGQNLRIEGDPGSPEWHANYQKIHAEFQRPPSAATPTLSEDIFSEVVKAYFSTPRFIRLKDTTKASYRIQIRQLLQIFGDLPIGRINARHISHLRDRIAETSPRNARECMVVVRLLFGLAVERAIIQQNPALGVSFPVGYRPRPWRPWTKGEIDLFLSDARPTMRRAVTVLLYTGQRRSDVISMRRDQIKDNMISGIAEKTGKTVYIPIHRELAKELATPLPVESVYLVCGTRGQKLNKNYLSTAIRQECFHLGMKDPPPLHGLRKNAVMALIEARCPIEEVNAITAQSEDMVRHYAREHDRRGLARAAVLKWERAVDDT